MSGALSFPCRMRTKKMQSGSSVSCLNTLKPPSEVLISSSTPSTQLNLNPIGRLRFMRSCQRGPSHGVLNRSNGGTSPDRCVRLQVEWLFSAEACNKSHQWFTDCSSFSSDSRNEKSDPHRNEQMVQRFYWGYFTASAHKKPHVCYLQQGFKRQTRFNLYFMLLLNSDSREITGHEGTENQTSVSQR